jgi:hypothetical protein
MSLGRCSNAHLALILRAQIPMSLWNLIRLELSRTPEFPEGSASRAYMLRVPLDAEGLIDDAAMAKNPAMATVRRFWPNEPDQTGYLVRDGGGWAFSYAIGDDEDEKFYRLRTQPLRIGDYVTISEPDGVDYPFRVTRSVFDGVPDG